MKKMLFVMNPIAGQQKAKRSLADILSIFNRAGYQITAYMTGGPGDGAAYVERMAGQVDLVVCCGGDGTFNETVTGALKSGTGVPLGYIPAGTTNDLAASIGLPGNCLEAARQIVEGTPVSYDVGRFGDRHFAYVASFGAFTRTSYATPQNVKNALGHTAYLLEGISELSQIRKLHVRLELDGGEVVDEEFLFGAISNSTSVGGILTLDPKQVDMGDGRFELLLVRSPKDLSELAEGVRALRSQKYNCRMIRFLSASRVKIWMDPGTVWSLDGERAVTDGPVTVENLHHAIRLMKRRGK